MAAVTSGEYRAPVPVSEALEPRRLLAATILGGSSFSTIQAAVTAATAGQTIIVDPGTYTEAITVNKSLTIKGAQSGVDARSNVRQAGGGESVVNVANAATFGFNITASDVVIDGFTVQGNSGIPQSEVGILIAPNQSGTHVVNNIVSNNVAGMYLVNGSSTDGAVIQHNVFSLNNQPGSNGGRGIYTNGGIAGSALQNVSIDGNFFYQNLGSAGTTGLEAAISLEAMAITPTNIGITNNTFENGGKALLAINTNNLTITGNTITDSQDKNSGALRFEGGVTNVTIQNNNIYYNLSPAIRMDSKGFAADNSGFNITGNNMYGNAYVPEDAGIVAGSVVIAPGTYAGPGSLPMQNNWWGDASGPGGDGPGTGDSVKAQGNTVTFTPFATSPVATRQTPFTGLASVSDSTIQAAAFDQGGSNAGFLVGTGTANSSMNFRETAVQTATTTDPGALYNQQAYVVTGLTNGQWLAYTLNVPTGGTFKLDLRVAAATGGPFHITLDGTTVGGAMTVPNTGGNTTWQTISSANFSVTSGPHVLKILADGTGAAIGNFHWLRLTTVSSTPTAPTNLVATPGSNQILLTWTNTASNQAGFQIDRSPDGTTFTNAYATVGASATSYSDTAVTVGTSYFYRVEATNASGTSPSSNVASAVATASGPLTYLSDLTWVSATAGFGTVQKDTSINGNPIKLRGTTYPKGLGTHAASQIVYNIGGQYTNFAADVGVDDEEIGKLGTVTFQVLGDSGAVLFPTTAVLTPTSAVVHINISVAGVQQLTLVVGNGGDDINFDHADWAGARLLQLPAAPGGLTATAVSGGINLAWTNNATNQTGFEVDRSTDGTTFTLLNNTVAANVTAYSDTSTLTPGTTYYYRVEAINAGGAGAGSNIANAVPLKLTPVYSGLTVSPAITYGAPTTTLAGTVKNGTLIPTGNVTVTVNGVAANAAINQTTGAFTVNYDTHALPASITPYTITYGYAGDTKFGTGSDTTTAITVNKRLLHVTATGANKPYDGLTSAQVTLADDRINTDVLTDSATSSLFADKNFGTGKTITIAGLSITGTAAGNYTLAATTATATANITARTLHITPLGVDKVYDGLLADTLTETDDRITGDVFTFGYLANFADKNVGPTKPVTITGMNVTGTDSADYVLSATTGSTTANVTARALTVTATGVSRPYDGTTSATVTLADNRITGDVLTTSYTSAAFADRNVAAAKPVSVGGIALTGTGAANYTLGNTTATASANITAKALTVTATGVNKVYDRTTSATVTLADNRIAGDVFTDSYTSASFVDKQAGNGKTIAVTGIALTGPDSGNYSLSTAASATANVTPAGLTVGFTGADKVYNGNTTATLTTTDNRIAGDAFTVNYTASFADKTIGVNKTVSVTGINLTGTDSIDYLPTSASGSTTANITARTLTFTATGVNKVYDGTNSAAVTLTDNRIAGDVFTDSYQAATFPDKNIGINRVITVSGLTVVGADSGNYLFGGTTTGTATVTPKPLAVTATATGKIYDGNTSAVATLSDNRLGADVFTDSYTSATFANRSAGLGKTVTVSGITLTGTDAGNYTPNPSTTAAADIGQRSLSVTAAGVSRGYDGTASATVTLSDNRVSGDVFTNGYASAAFADKNVGVAKFVSVSGISASGTDAANYSSPNATAGATADITRRALTVTATGVSKIYDGNITAAVTLSDNKVAGDVLADSYTTAAFANKNVGPAKTVSVSGIAVTGADAGNYTFNSTATASADVTQRSLGVTATGVNKVYDGTASAAVTLADNRISGDVFTAGYTAASFADKNVAAGKTVTVSGINLTGTDAGNYLPNPSTTATADMNQRSLTVTATGVGKIYDGNTTAAVTLADNRVSGDVFTDSYTGAAFANKNVGTARQLSVSGISIAGTDAGNYSAPNTTANTTADITRRALTVAATGTGASKVYDGTTSATVALTDNRVAGDALGDTYTAALFADKNVGTAKLVSVSGITVTGADVGNYTFNSTATTSADIGRRNLAVTASGVDKTYDGNTSASVTLADNRVSGDVFTDSYTSAAFVDKTKGSAKTVNVSGIAIAGTDAANYLANTAVATTANISPRILTISATGTSRPYDATTSATVTLTDNRVSGDVFADSYGSAVFANKNAGLGRSISVGGITVLGTDAVNYVINTTATATADISALAVTGSITASNKVYDATTAATIATRNLSGALPNDVVSLSGGAASFDTKNFGIGKTVTATGFTLAGADAVNYGLGNSTETATADITTAPLTGSITAAGKTYDGTATATILTRSLAGVLPNDVVSLTGGTATFDTKNFGPAKTVTATGLTLAGADLGNYTLSNPTETATAAVTQLVVSGSVTASDKVYDATTVASLSSRNVNGVMGTDVVSLTGGSATFDTKNIGAGKTVTATGLSLSGADSGNYSLFNATETATAAITPRALTGSVTASDKPYDGAAFAGVLTRNLTGVQGADVVALAGGVASFDTKNVGAGKTVTVTGLGLAGDGAANYTLSNGTETTTASITPELAIDGTAAADDLRMSLDSNPGFVNWFVFSNGAPVQFGQLALADPLGLTINGNGGTDTLQLDYSNGRPLPGTLHLNGTYMINGLDASNPLALANTSLEVGNSTIYFAYSGQSPVGQIRQALAQGYGNGTWVGAPNAATGAIVSSNAAAGPAGTLGIGYADSADGLVAGQPVGTLEVRFTLMADANLDRVVNSVDAIQMARNYNLAGATAWDVGNFNYDSGVNMSDALLLQKNFNGTTTGAGAAALAPAVSSSSSAASSGGSGSAGLAPVTVTPTPVVAPAATSSSTVSSTTSSSVTSTTPAPTTVTPPVVAIAPVTTSTAASSSGSSPATSTPSGSSTATVSPAVTAVVVPVVAPAATTPPSTPAPVVVRTSTSVNVTPVVTATAVVHPTTVVGAGKPVVTPLVLQPAAPAELSKAHKPRQKHDGKKGRK